MEPAANQGEPHENNNNNPNRGGAMAEEDLLNKMEELRNAYDRLRAEKDQAAAEANRVAEAEAARRTEEAEYESDWDFHDPIASEIITFRGNIGPTGAGPRGTASNVFAAEPTFNYTANLNLDQPNLSKPEEGHYQANTPVQSGGESSDSECDYA